jgi:hypothetical protein
LVVSLYAGDGLVDNNSGNAPRLAGGAVQAVEEYKPFNPVRGLDGVNHKV